MYLDAQLNLLKHLNNILTTVKKTMEFLCTFLVFLPRQSFAAVYKVLIRPHLVYEDIIYDQSYKNFFHQKMSQYNNAALAITGAIRGTSKENFYQELGLELLSKRLWYIKL